MNRCSAKELANIYGTCDWVHDAEDVSEGAVMVIQKRESNDNVQSFRVAAENGWRIALRDPHEGGDTILFVPMECVDDE